MFQSRFETRGPVALPEFSGTRVMMMPIVLGDLGTVPLTAWLPAVRQLFGLTHHRRKVGYLTIDEKEVQPGASHRRSGLHVDGIYMGEPGAWGGGGNGMITVSSHVGCRAWDQDFEGWPGDDGECDHLRFQCQGAHALQPGIAYWLSGLCVHESIPVEETTRRQFVRLSLPSNAPWFEGYTENPLGIRPSGPILPRRQFMGAA